MGKRINDVFGLKAVIRCVIRSTTRTVLVMTAGKLWYTGASPLKTGTGELKSIKAAYADSKNIVGAFHVRTQR